LLAACPAGRSEGSRRSGTAIASPSPTAPVGVCHGKPAPFPSSADLIRNRTIRLPESFGQEIAGHPQCPGCSAVRQPRVPVHPHARQMAPTMKRVWCPPRGDPSRDPGAGLPHRATSAFQSRMVVLMYTDHCPRPFRGVVTPHHIQEDPQYWSQPRRGGLCQPGIKILGCQRLA
jgi:hypothetical protein